MNKKIQKFLNLFGGEDNITKVDYSDNHLYVTCNVNKVDLENLRKFKGVEDVNLTDKCEVTFKNSALEHYDKFEVLPKSKAFPLSMFSIFTLSPLNQYAICIFLFCKSHYSIFYK